MTVPFVVFSLPRSRTFWLAHFLSPGQRRCGHDIALGCQSKEDFAGALRGGLPGTVETGAIDGWRDLVTALPAAKLVVLRRDVLEVAESLDHGGWDYDFGQLAERSLELDLLSEQPGVVTLQWEALRAEGACAWLYEYCLGLPHDHEWWSRLVQVNLQVDPGTRREQLTQSAPTIAKIKSTLRQAPLPGEAPAHPIVVAVEPWDSIYPECLGLAEAHWDEVEAGVPQARRLGIDAGLMGALSRAGALVIVTARRERELVGYFTWTINRDPECLDGLIADQGAWFVAPGLAAGSPAERMFDRSVVELRARGVSTIYPHHRTQGRGAHLGKFFERKGARHIKEVYSLDITTPGSSTNAKY